VTVDVEALKRRLYAEYPRGVDGDEAEPECAHENGGTCNRCGSNTGCYRDHGESSCPYECPACTADHPCPECGHERNCDHRYECNYCEETIYP
jgi:hypothetical protein